MIQSQENARTDRKTEEQTKNRWKDGQTLFHRTLPATAKGPTKNTRFICLSRNRLMNSLTANL